jgi:hypothetical protein
MPCERRDRRTGRCGRIGDRSLRDGLAHEVARVLPAWSGRLTPHTLRHYCASSLYARGIDLKAIQELLGHVWLSTTTRYVNPRELHQTGEFLQVVSCPRELVSVHVILSASALTWRVMRVDGPGLVQNA